jgi:hypothetical protein
VRRVPQRRRAGAASSASSTGIGGGGMKPCRAGRRICRGAADLLSLLPLLPLRGTATRAWRRRDERGDIISGCRTAYPR